MSDSKGNLDNPKLTLIIISILVKRLGGSVRIDQDDINSVAYDRIAEEGYDDGHLELHYMPRGKSA